MLRVVAFDFDGVILESNAAKTRAFGELVAGSGQKASEAMIAYHEQNRGVSRFVKFDWFYQSFLGRLPSPDEVRELNERFNALSMQAVLDSEFVPGVLDFLRRRHTDFAFYIVSGTPQPELTSIVSARGLEPYFKAAFGTPVTKAAHLRHIMEREGAQPGEVLMVGDARTDLEAAQETGTLFYGRGDFPGKPCGPDLGGLERFVAACRS